MFICLDWIKLTSSYKKLNYINLLLIQAFEELLPTKTFSLRAELEMLELNNDDQEQNKANMVLAKENILQKIFFWFYVFYLLTILFHGVSIILCN